MGEIVYLLCAVLSLICTFLLFRGYRQTSNRLLLWTALSFALLAANNVLLFVDLSLMPDLDMQGPFWRNFLSASSGGILLGGLIWEVT